MEKKNKKQSEDYFSDEEEIQFKPSTPDEEDMEEPIEFSGPEENTRVIGQDIKEKSQETFLQNQWSPSEEEDETEYYGDEDYAGTTKEKKGDGRNLKSQVSEEGRKFYLLLIRLMADPQKEIHSMYEQKPLIAFSVAILLNVVLIAVFQWKAANRVLVSELGIGILSNALILGALFTYLKMRKTKTTWEDALAVLGIAHFPLVPCILVATSLAFISLGDIGQMFYNTGTGFSFLFVFLCFIEIFDFPVKRSIYAIPAIFVGSEFVIRTIAIF